MRFIVNCLEGGTRRSCIKNVVTTTMNIIIIIIILIMIVIIVDIVIIIIIMTKICYDCCIQEVAVELRSATLKK